MALKASKKQKGFSLIELSIAMVLVGLMTATALQTYKLYRHTQEEANTKSRLATISLAIGQFVAREGRYPCPAQQFNKAGDAAYGMEQCPADLPGGPAVGACTTQGGVNGVCRVAGVDDLSDADTNVDNALMGAIPFVTVGIPMREALDGFGRRYTYVVSEEITKKTTDMNNKYALRVETQKDVSGVTYLYPPDLDHGAETRDDMVVISHGVDGKGAYTVDGRLYSPCTGTGTEIENCDLDGNFVDPNGAAYLGEGNWYNDDRLLRDIWEQTNYWTYEATGTANVYNRYTNKVGVGTNAPTEMLDVVGNIRADNARVTQICDGGGGACFEPEKIGGSGMLCPKDGLVVGYGRDGDGNVRAFCAPFDAVGAGLAVADCPPGKLANGVGADGTISCVYP